MSVCSNKSKRKLLLSAFALLNQSLVHGQGLSLSSELKEREALRKHRDCYGMLATSTLQPDMREALQNTIRLDSACFHSIMHDYESVLQAIVDTGCTNSATPFESDFVPGTLKLLDKPTRIGGIAGDIPVKYEGQVRWETLGDDGSIIEFHTTALFAPGLPSRLFSPQSFLAESQLVEDHFRVFHDRTEWHANGKKRCTIPYDKRTFLPKIVLFQEGSTSRTLQAMAGCVSAETNQNLSTSKRHWLHD